MKPLFLAMALCAAMGACAQNVGIGTSSPNVNAKLDITATDKGMLIPRMDSVHRKLIPATIGLMVYDSTTKSFWYNTGAAWQNIATAASGWSLTGNAGLDASTDFLGTTDLSPLIFKINNQFAGSIDNDGVVSIGSGAFAPVSGSGSGPQITAVGFQALHNNIKTINGGGFSNTAIGNLCLQNNTTGYNNSAAGSFALNLNTTGKNNAAMGTGALQFNTVGFENGAFGFEALYKNNTGNDNAALGNGALRENLSGSRNVAVGSNAAFNTTTASGNTAIGHAALYNNSDGSYNTALGYAADFTANTSLFNSTAIGANAKVDASNKIRLGDANVTSVESNGVFNTVSDGRFKYNVQEDVKGLDFIMNLRPVTYQFDTKKQEDFTRGVLSAEQLNTPVIPAAFNEANSVKRTGFIAQEVAAAAKETGYDFDGVKIPATDKQYYSLSYASFVVPLVKAMQEQQQTIDALKKQNELLRQQNEIIIKRLEALEEK